MDKRAKRDFFIKISTSTLILYGMTVITYFIYFYKPYEPINHGVEDEFLLRSDELLKSVAHDEMIMVLLVSFILCAVVSLILMLIYQELVFYKTPVVELNAWVKAKNSIMNMYGDHKGFFNVGYSYTLTFETEAGEEMKFRVLPKHYMIIMEGNKGVLKYKQASVQRFVDFDIKEVG